MLFWELYQQSRISAAEQDSEKLRRETAQQSHESALLRVKVERLTLACQALWELLRDEYNLSEEELIRKMKEVDLRDGREDGRIGSQPVPCPSCGKPADNKRSHCILCGAALSKPHLFDS